MFLTWQWLRAPVFTECLMYRGRSGGGETAWARRRPCGGRRQGLPVLLGGFCVVGERQGLPVPLGGFCLPQAGTASDTQDRRVSRSRATHRLGMLRTQWPCAAASATPHHSNTDLVRTWKVTQLCTWNSGTVLTWFRTQFLPQFRSQT